MVAFDSCRSLTDVTFLGIIATDDLGGSYYIGGPFYSPFMGDLRDKYLTDGIGTYTTTAPVGSSSVWMKQN